jgi:hypothetical protein
MAIIYLSKNLNKQLNYLSEQNLLLYLKSVIIAEEHLSNENTVI